jgi:hypothetical protein
MSSRLPRFERAPIIAPLQLTGRDRQIIRFIYRHRFLSSPQIAAFVGGSSQQVLRRLQLLYHHDYLERPRAQIDYYHRGGSRPMVYGLGTKGSAMMRKEMGAAFRNLSWKEKNSLVGRIFLEHTLFVSEVMLAFELACRSHGSIRLLTEEELRPSQKPFRWKVNGSGKTKIAVVPDRTFALEFTNKSGAVERAYFFLEADRGTMPVVRNGLTMTSFYRKIIGYEAIWSQSIHSNLFGFHRFQVITVSTSAKRVNSIVEACSRLKRGHGLFLIADKTILEQPNTLFSAKWQTGRKNESASLLDIISPL